MTCTGEDDEAVAPRRWRIAPTFTWSATEIVLDGDDIAGLRRASLSAVAEHRLADDWTLVFGAGASLDGELTSKGRRHDIFPGPVGVVGASYRVLAGDGWVPFLMVALTGSASTTLTEREDDAAQARLSAFDVRASVSVGEVFANAVAPYLTARAFGGPILWARDGEDVSGSDRYHYQLGAGLLASSGSFDAYFELVPLGERAATFGAGYAF